MSDQIFMFLIVYFFILLLNVVFVINGVVISGLLVTFECCNSKGLQTQSLSGYETLLAGRCCHAPGFTGFLLIHI
jgi:hypothetical protein